VTSLFSLEVSGCLFRVAQEALQNIAQYSHAKTASMELKFAGREAVLRVSDDGVGINDRRPAGVGLTYMREQVLALDGKLEISSAPSRGTVVQVALPVSKSL
jgi:signal transduction histidine kinase